MSSRNKRKRSKYVCYDDDDDDDTDESSDDDFDEKKELSSKFKRSSSKESLHSNRERSTRTRSSSRGKNANQNKKRTKSKQNSEAKPKKIGDYTEYELTHDPSGAECRFVPFDKIDGKILNLDMFLKEDEIGINTFIPGWQPRNPHHLEQFGYKQELAKIDYEKLSKMSLEELETLLNDVNEEIEKLPKPKELTTVAIPGFSTILENSIAINADVQSFDWEKFGRNQLFDVITMDPPWQIATTNVTRGVNIAYEQLSVDAIANIPLHHIQKNGYIFMWVIASQFSNGVMMLKQWGYKLETYMNWTKISKYGRYMPSHGYYFQHNKETLLIGLKGDPPPEMDYSAFTSLIVKQRGVRQSQKPEMLYELIEKIFPGSMYLEIFARPHNLRNGWVSIGIELPT